MAYVYRHIRLDKNVPFYIGISADDDHLYKRSNRITGNNRNYIWKRIASKAGFEVEIMLDDISWEDACIKEKEFIRLYGRKNNKTGILANLTDGGEGNFGLIMSDSTKKLLSEINSIPVARYSIEGKFIDFFVSGIAAAAAMGIKSSSNINTCANGKKYVHSVCGFIWRFFNGDKSDIVVKKEPYSYGKKTVSAYDKNGQLVKVYHKIADACEELNITHSAISRALKYKNIRAAELFFRHGVDNGDKIDTSKLFRDQRGVNGPMYGKVGSMKGKFGSEHQVSKNVIQIDPMTNKQIKEYGSIIEAARELNIGASAISACCKGKLKTSGKFIWKYI